MGSSYYNSGRFRAHNCIEKSTNTHQRGKSVHMTSHPHTHFIRYIFAIETFECKCLRTVTVRRKWRENFLSPTRHNVKTVWVLCLNLAYELITQFMYCAHTAACKVHFSLSYTVHLHILYGRIVQKVSIQYRNW